jgi:hypothetical protein
MSNAASLIIVQNYMTRYGMTTYLILGSIGLIFNIIIFSQSAHRQNSCALYILTMSICALLGLHISVVPLIYALDHPNPLLTSLVFCEMQFYIRNSLNQMTRTFLVLAGADRFASCSDRANIRAFNQPKIAKRIILSTIVFWLIHAIFPTLLRTLYNGVCDARNGVDEIIYTIDMVLVIGFIPVVSMLTFVILLTKSLKHMRQRIQPSANAAAGANILRKRDRDMIRMLLIELIFYMILIVPDPIMDIYKAAAANIVKIKERQNIETFAIYFTRQFILYMANTFSFWIFLSISQSYRLELKTMIIKWYRFIICKRNNQ